MDILVQNKEWSHLVLDWAILFSKRASVRALHCKCLQLNKDKTKVFFWLKKKGIRWVSLRQRQANPVADHKRINHHILRWYTWITRVQRQENPATVFYCWSHLTRRTCKPVLSTMVALSSVSSSPLSIPTPSVRIPHICHFFYTHTFFVQKILHSKVC